MDKQELLEVAYDNQRDNQLSTGEGANQDGVSPDVAHDLGYTLPEEVQALLAPGPRSPAMLAVRSHLAEIQTPKHPSVVREDRIMGMRRARIRREAEAASSQR